MSRFFTILLENFTKIYLPQGSHPLPKGEMVPTGVPAGSPATQCGPSHLVANGLRSDSVGVCGAAPGADNCCSSKAIRASSNSMRSRSIVGVGIAKLIKMVSRVCDGNTVEPHTPAGVLRWSRTGVPVSVGTASSD